MIKLIAFGMTALATTATVAATQQLPDIRQLGPTAAVSSETFGPMVSVRHLPTGVLVNDMQNRRVLMLDAMLENPAVVADTTPATANAYSGRSGGLIAYRGDSSLFVDAQSMSMLVIDPTGKVARVMSVPRSRDAGALGNSALGTPAFDGRGRLVYRGMPNFQMRPPAPGAAFEPPQMPDSAAVVGVNLETRVVDTLGYTKVPKLKMDVQRDEATGRISMSSQINPLPVIDDWAVLSDGSIAFVRGRDYHVDWIRPDGSRESSAKIPFEWQRLSDDDKVAFIDSVKAARERMLASAPQPAGPGAILGGGGGAAGGGGGGAAGGGVQIIIGGPGGGGPGGAQAPGGARGGGPGGGMNVNFVPPNELPDYKPAFFAGAVRADQDGNLWVRTIPTKGTAGGPVYDVINAKGELTDRVQVPKDRVVAGFGAGGVVYLLATDGTTRKLERARFK